MKTYIKGIYKRSIYESDKGYIIGIFRIKETNNDNIDKDKTITFTGYFHELKEDDNYIFYGEEVDHPRYGKQFNVTEYERIKPTDKEGIVTFLSSDLFPGVGETLAKSIVDTLGNDALNIILKDKSQLYLVPKLTEKKANKIYEILRKYEESSTTIVYLTDIGFSMKDALSIYSKYKIMTMDVIKNNIYKLAQDIIEISFEKVDKAAQKIGIEKDDERRITSTIIYIMSTLMFKNGDTYLTKEEIIESTNNYLRFNINDYDKYFKILDEDRKIKIYNDKYYLKEIWDSEENISDKLYRLATKPLKKDIRIETLITEMENNYNITYNDKQKEAITKALENSLLIVTGGPGTGKTTIIKAITELYATLNKLNNEKILEQIALLAPTGRASKKMSENAHLPASTIHRFLKWDKENDSFMVNEENKSKAKLIIVDEVSMIDINLFDSLLKGLTDDIKLVLVGDYNQLPSVGPGNVLKDLIESEMINTVHLDLLYRQDEDSYILELAEEIKNGELSENFLDKKSDYTFLECSGNHIKKNLKNLCTQIVEKGYDYKRVQLLAPMYKGENGIDNLNKELQDIFNPKDINKREIRYGDIIFRENDKIMQLVNMPDDNVFNGDIGVIKYIKYGDNKNEIYAEFDDNLVKYSPKDFNKIKHGFIVSIHKSQGSEFEVVIMPICNSYRRMLYRKLIYTAVTRTKRRLIVIGEPEAFITSIGNNVEYQRKSLLKEKLMNKF